MASQEVQELKELPLEQLISAPLNAVINAQATAAMSTAAFIERIGFKAAAPAGGGAADQTLSMLFDDGNPSKYEVRTADVKFVKKTTDAAGAVVSTDVNLSVPFITMFNIPSIEIDEMNWEFNARLKRVEAFATSLTFGSTTKTTAGANAGLAAGKLPISLGASLKVESTVKTDFQAKFGSSKEAEYNLKISVKASQAAPPKGIEKLLGIAESLIG